MKVIVGKSDKNFTYFDFLIYYWAKKFNKLLNLELLALVNLSPEVSTLIFKISLSMTISLILFMAFLEFNIFAI